MKKIFTFCLSLALICAAQAQSYFKETFQTVSADYVFSLVPTDSKTVMLAANALVSQQAVPEDYIGEFASDGSLLWNKSFVFKDDRGATGAIKTADGGYAMLTFAGYLVKLKPDHSVQFTKKLGITNFTFLSARGGIIQTADKGYVFAGNYGSKSGNPTNDVYLCKTDSLGIVKWCKKILDDGAAYRIKQTRAGGFLVAGYSTLTDPDNDMTVVKADSLGNVVFSSAAGGTFYDEANDVVETSDGGCLLVGQTQTEAYVASGYLAKFTATGALQWTKSIKMPGTGVLCVDVLPDRQNTNTITSIIVSDSGANTGYQHLLNVSNNGTINKSAVSVITDHVSSFFSAGCRGINNSIWLATPAQYNGSYVFIVSKSDATGTNCSPATLPVTLVANEGKGAVINQASVVLSASTRDAKYTGTGDGGTTIGTLCSSQSVAEAIAVPAIQAATQPSVLSLSPNPATSFVRLGGLAAGENSQLTLLDAAGKILSTVRANGSVYNWNIAKLGKGIYYIRVQDSKGVSTLRFMKQ